jgi:hypothetical protein
MTHTITELKLMSARARQEGRECSPQTLIAQMGRMNLFAISGGKWAQIVDAQDDVPCGLIMPCGGNRAVEVVLNWMDLYTVRRVRYITSGANKGDVVVEETLGEMVYCTEVGEVAYRASCWNS